jgi:hypothetical protein
MLPATFQFIWLGFQKRRLKCEKLTDDRRWTPSGGKSSEFCGSYAPLNLKISPNILLEQLVSAPPLKLLSKIS